MSGHLLQACWLRLSSRRSSSARLAGTIEQGLMQSKCAEAAVLAIAYVQ